MGIIKEFWTQYFIFRSWAEYADFKSLRPPPDFNHAVQRVTENVKHFFAHHIILGLAFITLVALMLKAVDFIILNAIAIGGAVALFHVWETLEIKGHNVNDYEKLGFLAVVYVVGLWWLDRFRFFTNTALIAGLLILTISALKPTPSTQHDVVDNKKRE